MENKKYVKKFKSSARNLNSLGDEMKKQEDNQKFKFLYSEPEFFKQDKIKRY